MTDPDDYYALTGDFRPNGPPPSQPTPPEDARDLETKLRQDIGLLEWQLRDVLPLVDAHYRSLYNAKFEKAIQEATVAYNQGGSGEFTQFDVDQARMGWYIWRT